MSISRLPLLRTFANPRFRTLAIAVVLCGASARMLLTLVEAYPNMSDFRALFVPHARLAWAGVSPYHDIPLAAPGNFASPGTGSVYTPAFLMLMWPWTWLPDGPGRLLWIAGELATLAGVLVLVARGLALTRDQLMLAAALMMLFPPVRDSFNEGQVSIVLGLLIVAALVAAESGRPRLAGLCLGLAVAIKLTPVLFGVYLARRRRWAALVYAAACTVAAFLATVALGWGGYWSPFTRSLRQAGQGTANTLNQSINGVVLRLYDAHRSGFPMAPPAPWVQAVIVATSLAVLAALVVLIAHPTLPRGEQTWADISILLLVLPLVQPFAWPHHFAQAAVICPVAVVLVARRRLAGPPGATLALLYLLVLVAYHPLYELSRAKGADSLAHSPALQVAASLLFLAVVATGLTWARLRGAGGRPEASAGGARSKI